MASSPNKRQRMENVVDATGCPPSTSEPVDVKDGVGDSSHTSEPVEVKDGAGDSCTTSELVIPNLRNINLDSEDFSEIVHFGAFIDKTLLIKSMFPNQSGEVIEIMKVIIAAPNRFGKSVNMDMLKKFFEIEVDEKGDPKTCVKKNEAGKWIEDDEKTPTENFKLFRDNNLKIYQCHCNQKHTDEQMKLGLCASRQFFYEHCGQHPVIFVSFKQVECDTKEEMVDSFKGVMHRAYQYHEYLGKSTSHLSESEKIDFDCYFDPGKFKNLTEFDVELGLVALVEYLHKQLGRKVIILIDDSDAPIMRLIHSSKDIGLPYIEEVIGFISRMISDVMKGNEQVLGGLLNACVLLSTRLSSDANNILKCPFLGEHRFSEFFGFTEDEVNMLLKKPQFKELDEKEVLDYYNGYKIRGEGTKIYSVFPLVMYLENWTRIRASHKKESGQSPDKKDYEPKSYWDENRGVKALEKLFAKKEIRETISTLLSVGVVKIRNPVYIIDPKHVLQLKSVIDTLTSPKTKEVDLFLLYLKDRGYFNVAEKYSSVCTLTIPNGEIQDEIAKKFCNVSYYTEKYKLNPEQVSKYQNALLTLDWNREESFQVLANVVADMFPGNVPRPQNHAELLGMLYTFAKVMSNTDVHSEIFCLPEKESRLDLLIFREVDGTGIIIEVKCGPNGSARKGLEQIFDKAYYEAFKTRELCIIKQKIYLGLHFDDSRGIVTVCAFSTDDEAVKKIKVEEKCITKESNASGC